MSFGSFCCVAIFGWLFFRAPVSALPQSASLEEQRAFLSRDLRRKRLLHALFPFDVDCVWPIKRLAVINRTFGNCTEAEEILLEAHRTMRFEDGLRIACVKVHLYC